MRVAVKALCALAAIAVSFAASAQITNPAPQPINPSYVFNAFPAQNPFGPTAGAFQTNYPYPGQCIADSRNNALFASGPNNKAPVLPACDANTNAPSFKCVQPGMSAQSAASADCGSVTTWTELTALPPPTAAGTALKVKFVNEVLNPPDYVPDTTTYPGADYYEIGLHESWGYDSLAAVGAFPKPPGGATVGNGKQWTGIYGLDGLPKFTPVWGVGQINGGGGPLTSALSNLGTCQTSKALCLTIAAAGSPLACVAPDVCVLSPSRFDPTLQTSPWSPGPQYIATWPSISIRATKGRPVVVKWTNEFPNNHLFCPHPEAADWPCSIDRTFMGVKAKIDPALAGAVAADLLNQYGSPQQPDNSWVTHLHGADTPPGTDGFAEKWFGNRITSAAYTNLFVNPPFDNPAKPSIVLKRPAGWFDTYTYPVLQSEATIWFHDHTLGKTHHNVIAGPAGFFPVIDDAQHSDPTVWTDLGLAALSNAKNNYTCTKRVPPVTGAYTSNLACNYGWLDILTQPRDVLNRPLYDLFLAIQDRAFNANGSISFPNAAPGGIGQIPPVGIVFPAGWTSVTPGMNPQVHPQWVPEYFADHALVNGVAWPKKTAEAGWYRIRLVDGSDSRCWTLGFQSGPIPAAGAAVAPNVPFYVLANDQGYLKTPVLAPANQLTMCPGERYELLIDFNPYAGQTISMTNSAPAPFPVGVTPFGPKTPFADLNVVMVFNVGAASTGIKTCATASQTTCLRPPVQFNDPAWVDLHGTVPSATIPVRQVYLNEKVDGVTLMSLGLQLNGVPFEYKVTETPKKGTTEIWQFINTTVDAHPMHPHLVKHQIISRQPFNVGQYKALLCGSPQCQPGPVPGGEMQVVPDVTKMLNGTLAPVTAASVEGGFKDATQALPGMVTTIVANWTPGWSPIDPLGGTAPGAARGCTAGGTTCNAASWSYDDVTTGPYVWHCHINSHEDSEMMHTSLVVP